MSDIRAALATPLTNLFIVPRRHNKPHDGTLRGWMLAQIVDDEKFVLRVQRYRTPLLDVVNRLLTFFGGELFNVILLVC